MPEALAAPAPEPGHPTSARALWNVFSNWGGFFLSGLVNFFLAPFVVHHLGNTLYGISVLILALTGYLGLLDLGVRAAVTRYIARFHTLADHEASSRFTSSALTLFAGLGAFAILLSAALAIWAPLLPIPPEDLGWARVLLALLGPNVAAGLVSGVFSGVLMGLQRFDHVNAVGVLGTALRALAIVVALSAGGGIIALVWIHLATTVAAVLASAWISFRLYPQLRVGARGLNREHVRLVVSFSAVSFLLVVFDGALLYADSVMIGALLSASAVTFFAIASNLINYARAIVGGISKTSTPMASALDSQGDEGGVQRALLSGAGYASAVILPIAVTFLLRGSSFIGLWMGAEYADLSGKILWILSVGLVVSASSQIALAIMLGIGRHELLVPVFLAQAGCTLVGVLIVGRSHGLAGIAWATTAPYLVVSLLFWPWYVRRQLKIPLRSYCLSNWVRPGAAIVPFALGTLAVEKLWPASNLLIFFLQAGAMLPLALAGFWYVGLTHDQRETLSQALVRPAFKALWRGSE